MPVAERNHTQREVVLPPREAAFESLGELADACLPTLAARLWATCCWPKSLAAGGWKIGDHNFLVAEVWPDPEACLYVQLWSEPEAPVIAEVCSGEWNPGAVRYIRAPQRDRLQALGYAVGGQSPNFRKETTLRTAAEAEAMAREVLGIFFEVFGYRGQWPLELKWHQGERAEHEAVYSWVLPEDFARLAVHLGLGVEIRDEGQPVAFLQKGRRKFLARFGGGGAGRNLYTTLTLQVSLVSPPAIGGATVRRIRRTLPFARVTRAGREELILSMPLRFDGGVTVRWMANAFRHWFAAWRACERLLGGAGGPRLLRAGGPVSRSSLVH